MIRANQIKRSKIITVRIPKELDDLISEVYKDLGYCSKSEFVRDAVDEFIEYLLSSKRSEEESVSVDLEEELFEASRVRVIMI
ncbi:MAG: ribbon-helix-helix domain-containing protein [Sulfolobales archaeon]